MENPIIVIDSDSDVESNNLIDDNDDINIIGETRNIVNLADERIDPTGQNVDNSNFNNNNNNDDDELTILEERRSNTISLILPGNNTMEINVNNNELPSVSSFTNLDTLENIISNFPPLLRTIYRDSSSVTRFRTLLDQLPLNIINDCNRSRSELVSIFRNYIRGRTNRNRELRRYVNTANNNMRTNTGSGERRTPNDQRRDLFYYDDDEGYLDENINEIPYIRRLRRRNRVNFGNNQYSGPTINRSISDFYSMFGEEYDNEEFNEDNERNLNHFNDFFNGYNSWRSSFNNEQQSTQNIINIIQQREEREKDVKIKELTNKNKVLEEKIIHESKYLPEGYNSNFNPDIEKAIELDNDNDNEQDENNVDSSFQEIPICNLCGVELGAGIPNEFIGISIDDKKILFDNLVIKYNSPCPYQSLSKPSQLDRDLSKRTFISKCGHVFCGRCFTRIGNAKGNKKLSKKKLLELKGPSNPNNYGPRFCPAKDCDAIIRAKGKLKEIYF